MMKKDICRKIWNSLEDPVNSLERQTADELAKIEVIEIEKKTNSISMASILAKPSAVGLSKLFTGSSNKLRISFHES